jgi:hypothetical protein
MYQNMDGPSFTVSYLLLDDNMQIWCWWSLFSACGWLLQAKVTGTGKLLLSLLFNLVAYDCIHAQSLLTFMFYLNGGFDDGATNFLSESDYKKESKEKVVTQRVVPEPGKQCVCTNF